MANAMVIIAQYHMEVNLFGETICKSEEEPVPDLPDQAEIPRLETENIH